MARCYSQSFAYFVRGVCTVNRLVTFSLCSFSTPNIAAGDNAQASLLTINETTAAIASDAPDFTVVPQTQNQENSLSTVSG